MFSVQQTRRVTLPGKEADPDAPAFLVRVAGIDRRALFEAELSGPPWNGGRVHDFELAEELAAAAGAWLEPADLPTMAAVLQLRRIGEPLDAAQMAILSTLETQAAQNWPPYQALLRRRHNRHVLGPLLALRRFLVGWENIDAPFAADREGCPTDATLDVLSEVERHLVGRLILGGLHLSADEGNGFAPPMQSPAGPATSGAAGGRKTAGRAGKSTAESGPKTRR